MLRCMRADSFVLETLAHFVRSADGPPPGVPARVNAGFETRLVAICADQGISPIVSRSLDRLALPPSVSRVTVARLRSHSATIEAASARRLSLAARLIAGLRGAGVDSLVIGETLAKTTYPRLTPRPVSVIDLLVHERDVARALGVFERAGFSHPGIHPVFGPYRSEGRISERRASELVWYHHYIAPLFLTGEDCTVRLRMRLIDLCHPESEEYAWDRRAGVMLAQGSVDAVCLEDHLVERCVRAGMAAMADLGALVDIGIVLGQHAEVLDWDYVATRARRGGIYAAVVTVVNEVSTLFNIPDASGRIPAAGVLSSGMIRRWWRLERIDYAELPSPRAGRFRFGLVAATSPFSAARWLWRHL
ncbi:MAG: nucleotidyltransferase family protein, partial [Candidatus Krumholzibacteriota bacterium]|nr:nucleotidyltransferase family protein [Candidatus Krumholzibacteriota bacterium]